VEGATIVIVIGLGSNLSSLRHGDPRATCEAALQALRAAGLRIERRSRWYRSAPVPASDQPWFVNGVAQIETDLSAADLLALLHRIEEDMGRERRVRNEARVIDLDLLIYGDRLSRPGETPVLPHPRLAERAFVLLPLAELAPAWCHPGSGRSVVEMIRRLAPDQTAETIE
jgi:2-amino-4-hydroxy-6-hydroxymethyldihydropteridine diphosphokinase